MHRTRSGVGQSFQTDAVLWRKGDRVVSGRGEYKDPSSSGVNRSKVFNYHAFPRRPVDDEQMIITITPSRRRMKILRTSTDWRTRCIGTC